MTPGDIDPIFRGVSHLYLIACNDTFKVGRSITPYRRFSEIRRARHIRNAFWQIQYVAVGHSQEEAVAHQLLNEWLIPFQKEWFAAEGKPTAIEYFRSMPGFIDIMHTDPFMYLPNTVGERVSA